MRYDSRLALRKSKGMTQAEVGERIDKGHVQIGRVENGQGKIDIPLLRSLLDIYGVTDTALREGLEEMVRGIRSKGWWHTYRSYLSSAHADILGLEADATLIRNWDGSLFPAVLQLEAYTRAVLAAGHGTLHTDADRLDAHVRIRRERSRILDNEGFTLDAILGEATLRTSTDPAIMREQLDHVVTESQRPNVTVRVVPQGSGFHLGLDGPFSVFDLNDGGRIVTVQSLLNITYLDDPTALSAYTAAFGQLGERALNEQDSRDLMRTVARSL
ncbi:helix-turn-helix transcriptional regulator (plasmid) [Embleya sp. NBC_00888]|uniref:helix-turn-helix domain-containing protein n=1 Tax=Embleya sp. NBC_00888 TaxID=2975960 RepID=UPI002F90B667|nr:helix-turn-helix transcriptional regulator [Embleya sp. NBC_00888]